MEDLLALILSALGGALVAGLFTIFGAWRHARRDHERWVRERRFDAYLRFLPVAQEVVSLAHSSAKDVRELARIESEVARLSPSSDSRAAETELGAASTPADSLLKDLERLRHSIVNRQPRIAAIDAQAIETSTAFSLLGPQSVFLAALEVIRSPDEHEKTSALARLEGEMRDVLGISY